jgi:hypothetical protein
VRQDLGATLDVVGWVEWEKDHGMVEERSWERGLDVLG